MIRYSLLVLVVLFLSLYSFRDWYKSLCGLVVLMAVIERYDMPRQMLGITGLNAWNILFLFILLACVLSAGKEKLRWDFPRPTGTLLLLYLAVILIGFLRMAMNFEAIQNHYIIFNQPVPTLSRYVVDDLLNSIKYAIPGMLIFFGCNSKRRLQYGIAACLLASFLLGLQIIKWMPISQLANAELLSDRALRVLDRAIGYHRVDLAALMAGASWGFFVVRGLATDKLKAWLLTGAGVLMILALALTGGRTGYGTWLVLAGVFTVLKWKRLIAVIPLVVILVISVVPAARDRMFYGFNVADEDSYISYEDGGADLARITSDRILVWPIVLDRIGQAPMLGYGRLGFRSSGAITEMRDTYGERKAFPHPHNAFLELIIDNGIIGAMPIFIFFFVTMRYSVRLFRNPHSKLLMASGGLTLAFVGAQLIASIGGQSFYPRAGVVIMWCSIGLALRSYAMLQELVEEPSSASYWQKLQARHELPNRHQPARAG